MLKKYLLKSATVTVTVLCMLLLASCGGNQSNESAEEASSQESSADEKEQTESSSVTESALESETPIASSETPTDDKIVKIKGASDDAGIYSTVVRLTDQAADKGVVEMVYYGEKGSPQENSVVNTFRIEYSKNGDGTFEINTFFDGEVYQNQHGKTEVKVTNTFSANLRAGSVTVSYTPDGGEKQEILKASAEDFKTD